jgi:microcystin-dependent protein
MSRYDGLIIPRSYNEYINKTDPIAMSQALQLNNVMDDVPTSGSNKPVKSKGVYNAVNPIGTILAFYSNQVPEGYLLCDGSQFDSTQYPALYNLLGDNHTPDLRECALVGAGRSSRTMGAHDEYTLGQFKDDQLQKITGRFNATAGFGSLEGAFVQSAEFVYTNGVSRSGTTWSSLNFDTSGSARSGTTTHGKQVGINYIIKAI